MKLQEISIDKLIINRANDRHGELEDEGAAIKWLLQNRANHMKNIARDICTQGIIYDPPLVRQEGEHYIVYDGNRRITALKLLNFPHIAPTQSWVKYFSDLKNTVTFVPQNVPCYVENDTDILEETLYRRHTGTQGGIGQLAWDNKEKQNFINRTGKHSRINIAEIIEKDLKHHGYIDKTLNVPRTNLNRLLSAEPARNRVGISAQKNTLQFTHNPDKSRQALAQVVTDLSNQYITIENLIRNKEKHKYIDELAENNHLPTASDSLPENLKVESAQPAKAPSEIVQKSKGSTRKKQSNETLIAYTSDQVIQQTPDNKKILDLWDELAQGLTIQQHPNSIAVLFRVMLELSIDHYASKQGLAFGSQEKISNKFKKCLDHMHQKGDVSKNNYDIMKKFQNSQDILSCHTLNAYLHNPQFFPSKDVLQPLWKNLEPFLVQCLRG